jgi:Tfp pilus assembly PilM family ATPase/Tfp pilus assembly protein PilN
MRITTLNIGSTSIRYVAFQNGSAVAWGAEPLAGAVKNGFILEPATTGQQIKALFATGKLPRDKVIFSLNGLPFSYRFFTLPEMNPASLPEAIMRMAKKEMPLAPEDMYLSWRAYPGEKDERQFLVTGIARRPVDTLIKMSAEAGVKPSLLCLPHLSLTSLADRNYAIIADFEPDYSNLTLIVKGVPVGMHTVPSSGVDASLQDMAGQLTRELTRMTGFYNDNHPSNPVPETTSILLTGELANSPDALNLIQEKTGYPVEIIKGLPAKTMNIPPGLPLATFAVNVADAMQDIVNPESRGSTSVRDTNLSSIIEESTKVKKPEISWKKAGLWGALAIGIIALIFAYLSQGQAEDKIAQLKAGLQQAKQELAQKQDSAGQAKQTEDSISRMLAAVQQLKQENQSVFSPRDSVSDVKLLAQSLPPATIFDTIDITPGQITIKGTSTIQERVVDYVRTLESSRAFSSVNIIWIDRASTGVAFMITIIR